MASLYPEAMRRLINELTKLPTIGERTAARLAYHMVTSGRAEGEVLVQALQEALSRLKLCKFCFFLSDSPTCAICSDSRRTRSLVCVVEKPADVVALEKSGSYRGLYHVLHGVWSPLRGVGTEGIKIPELLERLQGRGQDGDPLAEKAEELILATGTTVEGDATALYIAGQADQLGIPTTRIAQGLPKGGDLEFADQMTLHLSLQGRRKI